MEMYAGRRRLAFFQPRCLRFHPTDPRRAFALVGRFSALRHRHHHRRRRHHRHPLSPKLVSFLSRLVAVVSSPLITRLLVKFVSGRGVSRGRSRNERARSDVLNKGSASTRLRTAFHFPFLVSRSCHLSPVPVAGLFNVVEPSPPMSACKVARLVDTNSRTVRRSSSFPRSTADPQASRLKQPRNSVSRFRRFLWLAASTSVRAPRPIFNAAFTCRV